MKNGNCPPLWAQLFCYLYKKITVKRNSDGSERAAVNHFFYMWIKQLFSLQSLHSCMLCDHENITTDCQPPTLFPGSCVTSDISTGNMPQKLFPSGNWAGGRSPDLPVWGWRFRQKYHQDSDSGGGYWREEENTCTCFDEIHFHQQCALQRHLTFSWH